MKAAVIGTGKIAKQHLACLKTLPGVEVAAVCDLWPALAESAAERFGVARWFSDHRQMLEAVKPDVVHVTTPPTSHFPLAMDAVRHDAHVIIEKPATVGYDDLQTLQAAAAQRGRLLIEDYNYLFNAPILRLKDLIASGEFGDVTHVEIAICLDILGPGSPFTDRNAPHPCLAMPGGAIADFLSHLASLCWVFAGPHQSVRTIWQKRDPHSPLPSDEFRALVRCERATASLLFSAHTQPDVFWVRLYGTRMRAVVNLFEPRLTIDRLRGGAKPLMPLFNGLAEARDVRRGAIGGLIRKLSGGPGAYEGLWELLAQSYRAMVSGSPPPVRAEQIDQVNRLVADLTREEYQL